MKAKDVFSIDTAIIADLAGFSIYWAKVANFLDQIENTPYENLSEKQLDWLARIEADHREKYQEIKHKL